MKKTILLLALLFLSPFPAVADDSPNTLTRTVWACNGLTVYYEYTTSLFNGRKDIADRFVRLGACRKFNKGLPIDIDSDGSSWKELQGPLVGESELIVFRVSGSPGNWVTNKYYALSPEGTWKIVTGNSFSEIRASHHQPLPTHSPP